MSGKTNESSTTPSAASPISLFPGEDSRHTRYVFQLSSPTPSRPFTSGAACKKTATFFPAAQQYFRFLDEQSGPAERVVCAAVRWQDLTRGYWHDRLFFFPAQSTSRLASGRVGHFPSAVTVTPVDTKKKLSDPVKP